MIRGITIKTEDFNENYMFLTIFKNNENLASDLEICQYTSEMEYWGYPIKLYKYNNIYGYLFSKELNKEDLLLETERILKKYNLDIEK